jgi:hypothetical protein
MTQSIYRLNGEYFGFIWQSNLFDKNSKQIGWVDGTEVWTTKNEYLGELLDGKYILRAIKIESPVCKKQCPPQSKPVPPPQFENIPKQTPKKGYVDALDRF